MSRKSRMRGASNGAIDYAITFPHSLSPLSVYPSGMYLTPILFHSSFKYAKIKMSKKS